MCIWLLPYEHQRLNLTPIYNIRVDNGLKITSIINFRCTKFLKIYLNSYITDSVWIAGLIMTEAYFNFLGCIWNVYNFINENGWFACVGWYKNGVIHYRALVDDPPTPENNKNNNIKIQVDNDEINYHIVELQTIYQRLLSPTSKLGRYLNALNFYA